MFKKLFLSFVLVFSISSQANVRSAVQDFSQEEAFLNKFIGVVKDTVNGKGTKEEKIAHLESVVEDYIDLRYVAKYVLGKYRRSVSKAKFEEYYKTYVQSMKDMYANNVFLVDFNALSPKISFNSRGALTVATLTYQKDGSDLQFSIKIKKKVDRSTGEIKDLKIIDVEFAGLSMLAQQRQQFEAVMDQVADKKVDHLIKTLKNRSNS